MRHANAWLNMITFYDAIWRHWTTWTGFCSASNDHTLLHHNAFKYYSNNDKIGTYLILISRKTYNISRIIIMPNLWSLPAPEFVINKPSVTFLTTKLRQLSIFDLLIMSHIIYSQWKVNHTFTIHANGVMWTSRRCKSPITVCSAIYFWLAKTRKLRFTSHIMRGNQPPVTGGFLTQWASNAEIVSTSWRHRKTLFIFVSTFERC